MVFTPLRIEKHSLSNGETNFLLFAFAVFTVGILFGSMLAGYGTFPVRTSPNANTAGVVLSQSPDSAVSPTAAETTSADSAGDTAPVAIEVASEENEAIDDLGALDEATFDEFFANALNEVRIEVETKTARTFVLGTEIERLKNESVTLVAAFEQNCGSWTDVCATTYKDALNTNNTAYNRLALELELLISELDRARESERIILASQ